MRSFMFLYYPEIILLVLGLPILSLACFAYCWEAELKKTGKGLSTKEIFHRAGD